MKKTSKKKSVRSDWKRHALTRPLFYIAVVFTISAMSISIMSNLEKNALLGEAYARNHCGDLAVAADEVCDPPGAEAWHSNVRTSDYDCSMYQNFKEAKVTCERSCRGFSAECFCSVNCNDESLTYPCEDSAPDCQSIARNGIWS